MLTVIKLMSAHIYAQHTHVPTTHTRPCQCDLLNIRVFSTKRRPLNHPPLLYAAAIFTPPLWRHVCQARGFSLQATTAERKENWPELIKYPGDTSQLHKAILALSDGNKASRAALICSDDHCRVRMVCRERLIQTGGAAVGGDPLGAEGWRLISDCRVKVEGRGWCGRARTPIKVGRSKRSVDASMDSTSMHN